jgi:glycine dehydrogenase subunit 1
MPGRIAGETADRNGNRCYVLTLQAREQHIRREKATSNICSNQALCALAATIYLTLLGPAGLREAAEQSAAKAAYLRGELQKRGHTPLFDAPYFREFAVAGQLPGGFDLRGEYPELNGTLLAVTEKRTRAELDAYAAASGGNA